MSKIYEKITKNNQNSTQNQTTAEHTEQTPYTPKFKTFILSLKKLKQFISSLLLFNSKQLGILYLTPKPVPIRRKQILFQETIIKEG